MRLHKPNGPIDGSLWCLRNKEHRYYGPSSMFFTIASWYLHGKQIK